MYISKQYLEEKYKFARFGYDKKMGLIGAGIGAVGGFAMPYVINPVRKKMIQKQIDKAEDKLANTIDPKKRRNLEIYIKSLKTTKDKKVNYKTALRNAAVGGTIGAGMGVKDYWKWTTK